MRFDVLAAAGATTTLVLGVVVAVPAPAKSTDQTGPVGLKFDHVAHAALDEPVEVSRCGTCHGEDKAGSLAKPARRGHQPCLSSGCHAEDFMSVGASTRKNSPERYQKAASFCLGCHQNSEGLAPSPFQKAKADNLYRNSKPSHYVEMNHLEHTSRTACRTCHVVDAQTFELQQETPGHDQCASCHKDNDDLPMNKCGSCHQDGAPDAYFKERTAVSDVRSCNSARYKKLKGKRKAPCFQHEHEGHRTNKAGEAVQCKSCHFMFESKSYEGHSYQTLLDIKQAPLMDNSRDRAHKKCGSAGCHRAAVDESKGSGRCSMCHSSKSILGSLLSGGSAPSSDSNGDSSTASEAKSEANENESKNKAERRRKRRERRKKRRSAGDRLLN